MGTEVHFDTNHYAFCFEVLKMNGFTVLFSYVNSTSLQFRSISFYDKARFIAVNSILPSFQGKITNVTSISICKTS